MKKIIFVLLLAHLSLLGQAQKKAAKAVSLKVEQLTKAMEDANATALNELTDDQLSYGHSSGVIDDKKQFVAKLTSGQSDFVSISISEQTITASKHTAIVRHILKAITNDNGKPGEVNLKVLLVWHKEKGAWKLIARQAVKAQ